MSDEHTHGPDEGSSGASELPEDPALREPEADAGAMTAAEVEDVVFPELGDGESEPAAEGGLGRLMDVSLRVSVELGRREMLIQDVLNLGHGSVLDLDRDASAPVDVLVNGKVLARGEVVVVGDNFGVRLTSLVDGSEAARNAA